MTAAAPPTAANAPAFTKFGAFALVVGGFALFFALLYIIGAGEDLSDGSGSGEAHAVSPGLNGYSGLVRLVEAQGYSIDKSRSPKGLETEGVLVLAPGANAKADDIAEILKNRAYIGPTLVILPKWWAAQPPPTLPAEAREKFKRGWVVLDGINPANWTEDLPANMSFTHEAATLDKAKRAQWAGFDLEGALPTATVSHAAKLPDHEALITDSSGRTLAFAFEGAESPDGNLAFTVAFLAEPDLANNYGLADPARAAAAIALIERLEEEASYGEVVFDLTMNGFGASENLLTLAFRPPFLAATLSLLAALLIVGWRAFQRFGPAAAAGRPDIAFGKRQLIANGAGLIVRARRFGLLRAPYAALSARRVAEKLSLARPDPAAIDAALARRLPEEEPFTRRAARLEAAAKPADILAAARSLDDLSTKLQQGQ